MLPTGLALHCEDERGAVMRMSGFWVAGVVGAMAAAEPGLAQSGSGAQRACAAVCLRLYPDATSQDYPYCLQVKCGIYYEDPAAPKTSEPRAGWGAGVTEDGQARYAGFSTQTRATSIYYLCDASGASSLSLSGSSAQPGVLTFSIDLEGYQIDFKENNGALYAYAPMDAAVMRAMMIGSRVEVYDSARALVAAFSLRGAAKAIGEARKGCE